MNKNRKGYRQGSFRHSLSPLAAAMLGLFSLPGYTDLYFNPALISADPDMVADLSRIVKDGAQLPGNYTVDIYINGKLAKNQELRFIAAPQEKNTARDRAKNKDIRDETGLMACLTRGDLEQYGVNLKAFPALNTAADEQCLSPGKFIPGAFIAFDFQRMRLDISVPQAAMRNEARGYIAPERWDDGITAAMLNYRFSGNTSKGSYGENSSHYLSLNSGLNFGPWRLRDYRSWREYRSRYSRYSEWQHTKTYIERNIVPLRSRLVAGDSITNGEMFDSLGFRGIQLATDENMYPDSQRGFAPVIRGTANTNARVSIRQNGYTVYQTFVPPGAFVINDLYPSTSSGDLEVTVTEADGSTQEFTVPYSSIPILQREGHLKYSLTAGRYQPSSDRYNKPEFIQGTFIRGLPHNVTVYGGMQYSPKYLAGLLGIGFSLGELGALSADITRANSTLADGSRHQGYSWRFLYARSLNQLGTTFQLTGYRYSTRGFHTLEETALKEMSGWRYPQEPAFDADGQPTEHTPADYYNLYENKRAKIQASISQQIGEIGSVYLSGVRQTYWNTTGNSDSIQAGFSSSIGSISYSLSFSYNRESERPEPDQTLFFSLSAPLDALFSNTDRAKRHSLYATYSASQDREGNITHQAGLSGSALEGNNLNWSLSQSYIPHEESNGNLNLNYQGSYGNGNLGYSYSSDYRQLSYGISGGMILHRDGLTIGQPLGETSVLVAAPGLPGVVIENETGVKTDWRGYAIKPYASVYRENRVALDTTSLKDDTDIDDAISRVVPTRGAIVRAAFKGYTGNRLLMTLTYNGKPLPFGSIVTAAGRGSMVGDEGLVYLSGMPDEGEIQAKWGEGPDKQCSASYSLSPADAEQMVPRIEAICH